jgi:endothelin-converting enzyme/putative endopeptidase
LRPQLRAIDEIRDPAMLPSALAALHAVGAAVPFRLKAEPLNLTGRDWIHMPVVAQAGLGLPEAAYYTSEEEPFASLRRAYAAHVAAVLELLGETPERAARSAEAVLQMETVLARASLPEVRQQGSLRPVPRGALRMVTPGFDWLAYLDATGAPQVPVVFVEHPEFLRAVGELARSRGLDDWKAYLRWHLVATFTPVLPAAFRASEFAFYGRMVSGQKAQPARAQTCLVLTVVDLGEPLGQRFMDQTLPPGAKARVGRIGEAIRAAFERDLGQLPWMGEPTRQRALEKLAALKIEVGPEAPPAHSAPAIVRGDALGNLLRGAAWERGTDLARIGRQRESAHWAQDASDVSARYDSGTMPHSIRLTAGILQPPFFDLSWDDAAGLGAIGSVIGHELTHGFDNQARLFDAWGFPADWWTEADARQFVERASCFAQQYSGYTVAGGTRVDGGLTLQENIADSGGLRLAYMALQEARPRPPRRDGFTAEQRFFLAYAQQYCHNATEQAALLRARIAPHAPQRYRVNGVLSNMPEFQAAFGCKAPSPMVRPGPCRVW